MSNTKSGPYKFDKIILCSGHLIDKPGRPSPRFPPDKEKVIRQRMDQQLAQWTIGAGDLAICGGGRGADIMFAESCLQLGAEVWLFIAMKEEKFLDASVRLPQTAWEDRYHALRNDVHVTTHILRDAPDELSVFAHANIRMIDTARAQAQTPANLYALLVWDEKATGDGPGGTSDFAAQVKKLGGQLGVINPTKL